MRQNQLQYIRGVLYALKRDYGFPIDLYQITKSEADFKTGQKTTQRSKFHVRRAIVLPTVLTRKYSHILYRSVKEMKYGGYFDTNTRLVIVDKRDLPKGFQIAMDDYAVYNQGRYEIKSVDELEHRLGSLLTLQETEGTLPREVLSYSITQKFNLYQAVATV